MKKALLIFITILAFACSRKESNNAANYVLAGDTIVIPANSNLRGKFKFTVIQNEPYRLQLLTAGTVKAIPTNYAEIAPPFQGRVLKSYVKLGMRVTPETALFEISSPEFISAQKIYFQQNKERKLQFMLIHSVYALILVHLKMQIKIMKI